MPRDTRLDCYFQALEDCLTARESGDEAAILSAYAEFTKWRRALDAGDEAELGGLVKRLVAELRAARVHVGKTQIEYNDYLDRTLVPNPQRDRIEAVLAEANAWGFE